MKGHLQKRGERSWRITLYLGRDATSGKKLYGLHTVQGNKDTAQKELNRLLNDLQTGGYVPPGKITVAEYLEKWMRDYAQPNVSARTLERYASIVKHHLIPALGGLPLVKLQPLQIQAHYSAAMQEGARKDGRKGSLSAQSILHHHRLLSEALKMAVRWQLLARNPCDAVEPPRVRPKEITPLNETGTAWLLDAAQGTRLYIPIMLAVSAGLRRGEILAVRWPDLNWESGQLQIRRALEETHAGVTIKEPKSPRGRRPITLPPLAIEALRAHQARQQEYREALGADYQDGDLICCVEDGSLWKPSAFTSAYRALLKRRNLTGPNFHALRHSHASQLLGAGVDIKVVSERLGHAKSSFTLDRYIHLLPGRDEEAARKIDMTLRAAIEQQHRPVA